MYVCFRGKHLELERDNVNEDEKGGTMRNKETHESMEDFDQPRPASAQEPRAHTDTGRVHIGRRRGRASVVGGGRGVCVREGGG